VPGVVDDNVKPAIPLNDGADGLVGRLLRRDVELDGTQINMVVDREWLCCFHLRRIAAGSFAHAGVDSVSGFGEGACSQGSEAGRCSCNEDDALHFDTP
jgi:hypothetical protein